MDSSQPQTETAAPVPSDHDQDGARLPVPEETKPDVPRRRPPGLRYGRYGQEV